MKSSESHLPPENLDGVTKAASFILDTEVALEPFDSLGATSRAYACQTEEAQFIVRHRRRRFGFAKEAFVGDHFGEQLPIPRVRGLSRLADRSVVCVSERLPGNHPEGSQLAASTSPLNPKFNELLQRIHTVDVRKTYGYGPIVHGWGLVPTPLAGIATRHVLDNHATQARVVTHLPQKDFRAAWALHRSLALEATTRPLRRLVHGDLKRDNILVNNGEITGIIDWARAGYYDPAVDLGILHVRHPGAVNCVAHAESIKANPETMRRRMLYYAMGECVVAIDFFGGIGKAAQRGYAETRLMRLAHEAETTV